MKETNKTTITTLGRKIDHIVYAVQDLDTAMVWFEQQIGIRPTFGGYHTTQGTKNALIDLGDECYLEILALDSNNIKIKSPRWMGIDHINAPQLTRWSLKSADLKSDSEILKTYRAEMGNIQGGQRKMSDGELLIWQLLMPLPAPKVELIPFMINWQNSKAHPTSQLPKACELISLQFTHPHPTALQEVFKQLHIDTNITAGKEITIKAKIKCPKGLIEI